MNFKREIKKLIKDRMLRIKWIDVDIKFYKWHFRDIFAEDYEKLKERQKILNQNMIVLGKKKDSKDYKKAEEEAGEVMAKIQHYEEAVRTIDRLRNKREELVEYVDFLKKELKKL